MPDEVSVAGMNDTAATRDSRPPMTVIEVYHEQMCRETIRLLMERIREGRTQPTGLRIKSRLIKRESTGPAPAVAEKKEVTNHETCPPLSSLQRSQGDAIQRR